MLLQSTATLAARALITVKLDAVDPEVDWAAPVGAALLLRLLVPSTNILQYGSGYNKDCDRDG